MSSQREGTLAILAAIFVLFSALFDPLVSVVVAIVSLVAFAVYSLRRLD